MADPQAQILTEAELVDAANSLLAQVNACLATFSDVALALSNHEVDPGAHPYIQDLIQAMVTGTGFITSVDAGTLVDIKIAAHNTDTAAHASILASLQTMQTNLTNLTTQVNILSPPASTDPMTEMEAALQAIDAQYDPILSLLQQAWNAAVINNTGTADDIAANIQTYTDDKAAARYAIMQEYGYYA